MQRPVAVNFSPAILILTTVSEPTASLLILARKCRHINSYRRASLPCKSRKNVSCVIFRDVYKTLF